MAMSNEIKLNIARSAIAAGFYSEDCPAEQQEQIIRKLVQDNLQTRKEIENFVRKNTYTKWWAVFESMEDDLAEIQEQAARSELLKQRAMDNNRIKNKAFRENSRLITTLEVMSESLENVFKKAVSVSKDCARTEPMAKDGNVGFIQLSDLHFGESINMESNKYDLSIAAKRLAELAAYAKVYFASMGIKHVAILMTGDLINSDRRLDEILENSQNRACTVFSAFDILQQFMLDMNKDFDLTIASVCGNESRITEFGWSSKIVSDSYDLMLHNMLDITFADCPTIQVLEMINPSECVVEMAGNHALLVHGHGGGLSNTAKMETAVAKVTARYAQQGVNIDYVFSGHIHQAYVSDNFSRSSGLPGSNDYSEKGLNLYGRSSQNIGIAKQSGGFDVVKVDLQTPFFNVPAYSFRSEFEAYHQSKKQGTYVIQSVVI